jgi:hypothetical protein
LAGILLATRWPPTTSDCRIAVTLMILLYLWSSGGRLDLSSILWLFTQ